MSNTGWWTPKRTAEALRLHAEGLSSREIAAAVGAVSRDAVLGLLWRQGASNERPQAAPRAYFWTAARLDQLRRLRAEGLTIDEIAIQLRAKSRAAVAHAAEAHGILKPGRKPMAPRGQPKVPPAAARPRAAIRAWVDIPAPVRADLPPVTLMDRRPWQCAYPIGPVAGPQTLFCGAPVERAWCCGFHYDIAYRRITNVKSTSAGDGPRAASRH